MRVRLILILFVNLILVSSCGSRKNIVYFQDEPINEGVIVSQPKELIYKPDDILTINVAALDPETVRPFNLTVPASNSTDVIRIQANQQLQTYLIDYEGDIDFPVLGKIKVAGLTRPELTELLTKRISEYVKDPIVNVRLSNFTITIIGEVNRPGSFTIQDERITILEALGLASDLTIFGERKDVLVIREVDGEKKFAKVDLRSINTINSPVYYLQQNDVIYVAPNNARVRSSTFNQNNLVLISAISTLSTIAALILANSN
ncbi:polysaccharide biosynthesis/export family protein [Winogradskyella aurantia]|uniref:Sugar transporter n=1 Tax=Winogradskyella aurantia TaxID=1915063 RepID=A0A265UTJ1_9FLAO|nr:polysaccharide biosynthesis/export family protein [Winogradskyella aurantia]OZV68542.1 sugar transporter [Winogradskyella aurantia]